MSFVSADTYDNINADSLLSCGNGMMTDIPVLIPKVVSIAYTVIQIAVPVVLVIMGSLDFFKGISAQKEDEIKKGQQLFIKRLIAAALVFFAFVITKVLISAVADGAGTNILDCAECFIENDCDPNV
jgi:surface polysaccharide O-acyltransferase-like enzyme